VSLSLDRFGRGPTVTASYLLAALSMIGVAATGSAATVRCKRLATADAPRHITVCAR
jgi:hypothetical protein